MPYRRNPCLGATWDAISHLLCPPPSLSMVQGGAIALWIERPYFQTTSPFNTKDNSNMKRLATATTYIPNSWYSRITHTARNVIQNSLEATDPSTVETAPSGTVCNCFIGLGTLMHSYWFLQLNTSYPHRTSAASTMGPAVGLQFRAGCDNLVDAFFSSTSTTPFLA